MGRKKQDQTSDSNMGSKPFDQHIPGMMIFGSGLAQSDLAGIGDLNHEIEQKRNQLIEAENKRKLLIDSFQLRVEKIVGHAVLMEVMAEHFDKELMHKWVLSHTKSIKDLKFYKRTFGLEITDDRAGENHV